MKCKIRRQYVCRLCCRKFATENALWTHGAFKHPATPPTEEVSLDIGCRTCGCSFTSEAELELHLLAKGATSKDRRLCRTGPNAAAGEFSSSTKTAAAATKDTEGWPTIVAAGPPGGEQCPSKERFSCSQCGRTFRDKNTLWTHLVFKHPDYHGHHHRDPDVKQVGLRSGPPLQADACRRRPVQSPKLISTPPPASSSRKCSATSRSSRLKPPSEVLLLPEVTHTARPSCQQQHDGDGCRAPPPTTAHLGEERTFFSHKMISPTTAQSHIAVETVQSAPISSTSVGGCMSPPILVEESREMDSLLLTTLVTNELLGDHVAMLEQRVSELQLYFSQVLADILAEEESTTTTTGNCCSGTATMVHMSPEEMQDMEVAGEVVILTEETTFSPPPTLTVHAAAASAGSNNKSRRRRRGKKLARVQPCQEAVSETVGGGLDPAAAAAVDGGGHRARLRI